MLREEGGGGVEEGSRVAYVEIGVEKRIVGREQGYLGGERWYKVL